MTHRWLLAITAGAAAMASQPAQAQLGSGPGTPTLVGERESMDIGAKANANIADKAAESARMTEVEARAKRRSRSRPVAAKTEDLVAGAELRDSAGEIVGRIASVGLSGAVVETAAGAKVEVPLDAFGKDKNGLLLGITKAEFDAAVAGAQ